MNKDLRIEMMTPNDLDTVYAMELEVFEFDTWPKEWFEDGLNDSDGYYYFAYWDSEPVGYCGIHHNHSTPERPAYGKIATLGVMSPFRQKGIGRALMQKMLDKARELGLDRIKLEVDTKNFAVKLYESFGFQVEELVKGYYDKSGGDAYIMWRYEKDEGISGKEGK